MFTECVQAGAAAGQQDDLDGGSDLRVGFLDDASDRRNKVPEQRADRPLSIGCVGGRSARQMALEVFCGLHRDRHPLRDPCRQICPTDRDGLGGMDHSPAVDDHGRRPTAERDHGL